MHYRISVLGTSKLCGDDGRPIESILQQPRRFALLVFLALESRTGPVKRDTVLGTFWPDKPQENARGSLNQAVHYLRRSLGAEAVRTLADTLEVNAGIVSCDATELLSASESAGWNEATDLYGGEFLPGHFDNAQSAEFEHWLDATRATLREAAARCAWKRAEAEESGGDTTAAIMWARRACDWSASDEAEVRRLMEMMDRLGDRGGVLEAFRVLSHRLEEMDAAPAPATRELLARMRARWAEEDDTAPQVGLPPRETPVTGFGEPVSDEAEPRALEVPVAASPTPLRKWSWLGPVRKLASAFVTLGIMVAILSLWAVTRDPAPVATRSAMVVIEEAEADESGAAMARMLRDGVLRHLREMTAFRLVAEADEETLARERGFILRSNLHRMEEELEVSIHLLDGEWTTLLATTTVGQSVEELPAALDGMARSIAQFVRREVGSALDERRLAEADVPKEAITLVRLGRQDMALGASLWRQRSAEGALAAYEKADSMFTEAASLVPYWDRPWIDRAETAYRLIWIQRLSGAGDRSLESELAARGVRFADEAIAREGAKAESLELRALLREWQWLLAQPDPSGRSMEILARAEADARRATEMDPHRARAWSVLGATLLHRGSWAEAYWALGRAVAADTHLKNDTELASRLFIAAWETGNTEGARSWCHLLAERSGEGWPAAMCRMYLMAGEAAPDLGRLAELRRQAESWPYWPSVAQEFEALAAVLYARAGREDRARNVLAGLQAAAAGSDLPFLRAWALLELGEVDLARTILEEHVAASPATRASLFESRRFRKLGGPEAEGRDG